MRLEITTRAGQKLKWPQDCACCGASANKTVTTYPLVGPRFGFTFKVPYCARCRPHVLAETRGAWAGWWLGLLPAYVMMTMMYFMDEVPDWMEVTLPPVLVIPFFGGIILGKKLGRKRAAKAVRPECCSADPAVLYLERDSLSDNAVRHTFVFRNDAYARRFLEANRGLLEEEAGR